VALVQVLPQDMASWERGLPARACLGGTDNDEREQYSYNSCPFDAPERHCLAPHNLLQASERNHSKRISLGKRRGLEVSLGTGRPQM